MAAAVYVYEAEVGDAAIDSAALLSIGLRLARAKVDSVDPRQL